MRFLPLTFGLLAVFSIGFVACGGGEAKPVPAVTDSPAVSQTSTPVPPTAATAAPPLPATVPAPNISSSKTPDRRSCADIRGTPYRSSAERSFYLESCVDRTNCAEIEATQFRSSTEQSWYLANCVVSEGPGPTASPTVVNAGPNPEPASCRPTDIASSAARFSVGKTVTICGMVSGASYQGSVNGRPTFINFDRPFPNQTFTALIWGDKRGSFSPPPEQQFSAGACVRVSGLVETFRGDPQIVVTSPNQISLC